jgi:hypothetical protein
MLGAPGFVSETWETANIVLAQLRISQKTDPAPEKRLQLIQAQ